MILGRAMRHITILTGAGISAESGVPTFRDANGLWHNHKIEDVASYDGYVRNPSLVQSFYNARRRALLDPAVQPNAAHFALAKLQREFKGKVCLVTQNVDNLHERAGSANVLHMHGELFKVHCKNTQQVYKWEGDIDIEKDRCACCDEVGTLRPHIVWFGEMPLHMDDIAAEMVETDLFVSIGTSGVVYPAAGFVREARQYGALTLELNLECSDATAFNTSLQGKATELVPKWVDSVLDGSFTI
ncbi:NAD dependent deacetylase [Angomonas deanei]|nr:NAD dependent deacetylase [Angomonas deanei]|eukprot:EPY42500.1 NAD dependent deacetylase [Angomonas deanei]